MDWQARVREVLPVITGDLRRDREIQDEIAEHLADREQELLASGTSEEDTALAVGRELMLVARRRRRFRRSPVHLLRDAAGDVRYAARLLIRTPGFTIAAVATLALAIGATTALFSVVRGVLLRPLPFPEPERIVYVWEVSPQRETRNVVAPANFLDWQRRATSFSALGAMTRTIDRALTGSGEPTKVETAGVTPSVLDALRVTPVYGRSFVESDGQRNAPAVAILAYEFWMQRFAGQTSAIGHTLMLDDRPFQVVGILPPRVDFPSPDVDMLTNLWFSEDQQAERRSHNFVVIGRLNDGVTIAAADAEMDAIAATLATDHPQFLTGWSANVVGLHDDAVREVRPLLWMMFGVVIAVLLIACANLANLQLARAGRRIGEMAVRAAIGASSGRIFRQVLTESLLLATAGGVSGVLLAAAALEGIVAAAPPDIPFMDRVAIDPTVLGTALVVTIVCALLMGIVPAARVARTDLRGLLYSGRVKGDRHHGRIREVLVIAQVAIALVLVLSAGLLVRSFIRLTEVSPGYDPRGVLTVSVDLPRARYADLGAQLRFYEALFARLHAHPAVAGAAGTTGMPGVGANMTFSFAIEGRLAANPSGRETPVPLQGVTADYFDVMRIPVVEGRGFAGTDRTDTPPVVIVNEALARRHWPDGSAIGSRINFRPGEMPWAEVVGIVGDTRDEGLASDAPPTIYVPFAQRASTWGWMTWQTLVIRARSGDVTTLIPEVKAALWSVDPRLPLLDTATVPQRLAEGEARRTMAMRLLAAFAGLALLLSTIGVYAVMSYSVAERRQEIGIRIALGARPSGVARRVVLDGLTLAALGIVAGTVGALAATRSLQSLLYEIDASDPVSFVATAVLLLGVAGAAAWIPARRGMRVDPIEVLRD
jgi:putative ABC transport system permease protein